MKKNNLLLLLIILLTFLLRVYRINTVPTTLYGDEQAFAYNAYSILQTGADEYGTPYPLQFRSFDDYKAPIPVYLLVPFIKFLGLNAFAIRLPIVLASTATVFISYFLFKLFLSNKISLISMVLFAVSPWHVHLSRGYFEATLALAFFVYGIYFFLRRGNALKNIILAMVMFSASIYSYFTPRILMPLFLLFLIWYCIKYWKQNDIRQSMLKRQLAGLVFIFVVCLPLIYATFFGQGLSRFKKLSESNDRIVTEAVVRERNASNAPISWRVLLHNKVLVRLRLIKNDYLEHLSPNFWYLYGDNSLRYFTGNMGMFYLWEFPFLILGIFKMWQKNRKTAVFFSIWLLLAPIPAALVGRSFAVRSLAMLPAPFVFVSFGIYEVYKYFSKFRFKTIFPVMLACILTFFTSGLLIKYYMEYPVYAATWWGWENKAEIDYAKQRESSYEKIFLSDFYTGLPLAFATYNQIDPVQYRTAITNPVTLADGRKFIKFGKYYIGSLDINKERQSEGIIPPGSLYIARPEEADGVDNITAPDDGRIIFKVHQTN